VKPDNFLINSGSDLHLFAENTGPCRPAWQLYLERERPVQRVEGNYYNLWK
jgi:hypothetical protein